MHSNPVHNFVTGNIGDFKNQYNETVKIGFGKNLEISGGHDDEYIEEKKLSWSSIFFPVLISGITSLTHCHII